MITLNYLSHNNSNLKIDESEKPRKGLNKFVQLKQEEGSNNKYLRPDKDEYFDPSHFVIMFLDTDSVCLVTKLNRINHRRILLFIGNGDGIIGYAKGKGLDYQQAYENAFMRLKQNLIVIDYDMLVTNGSPLMSKFNDYRLWIYPRSRPNYWGSLQIYYMLLLTGMV